MTLSSKRPLLHALWANARPLDRLTWFYILAFGLGLVTLGRDDPNWVYLAGAHLILLVGIPAIIRYWNDERTGLRGFLRHLYTPLLYTFFYSETGVAMDWFFPGFFDGQIVAFEQHLFGVDPNLWLIAWESPLLNEWMMLAYFSYYLLVALLALTLFFQRRISELHGFLTASTIAFVISYAGFILYPVEGPRYYLAEFIDAPLSGAVFVPLVRWIIDNGAVHGGCMPSSHVAVALVVLVWAWRTNRPLGKILTPFVLTLFVSTVWGRFHYVSDVVAGWFVGLAGLWLAERWCVRVERDVWFRGIDARAHLQAVPRPAGQME